MEEVFVFVDNSNVWIEKKVSGRSQRPSLPSNRNYRVEYGRLLEHIRQVESWVTCPPQTIAMVAVDADFVPVIQEAQGEGWKVEVWYWSNAASELNVCRQVRVIGPGADGDRV